jgi:hypothetical protein
VPRPGRDRGGSLVLSLMEAVTFALRITDPSPSLRTLSIGTKRDQQRCEPHMGWRGGGGASAGPASNHCVGQASGRKVHC